MPACFRSRPALIGVVLALLVSTLGGKPISPPSVAGYTGPRLAAEPADDEGRVAEAQFDTTTTPLPPNVPSLGYHAAATSEFGDLVHLAGSVHFIDSITITMSSWAIRSDYPDSSALGFTHPITLTLYAVDRSRGAAQPGPILTTVTTPFLIPWRPEPDATATDSPLRPWRGADGLLYSGLAFNVTFDLGPLAGNLPEELIFGVAFNTRQHGPAPLGAPGPYDALHLGVSVAPPTVGTDFLPGAVYWKTADGRLYADGGTEGVNVFRRDTDWSHYAPAVRFNHSAYGTLADALGRLESIVTEDPAASRALTEARALVRSALDRTLWADNRQVRALWGRLVFDLLAEATEQLSGATDGRDRLAAPVHDAVTSLLHVAGSVAESALGDALIAGGDARRLLQAQDALEAAATASPATAIGEFGLAWREAQLALQ